MFIYVDGKQPVARKSKSLAEMGVKDGDNLIVTTEMKLPLDQYSDEDDLPDVPGSQNYDEICDVPSQNFGPSQMDFGKGPLREGEMRMGGDPYMGSLGRPGMMGPLPGQVPMGMMFT